MDAPNDMTGGTDTRAIRPIALFASCKGRGGAMSHRRIDGDDLVGKSAELGLEQLVRAADRIFGIGRSFWGQPVAYVGIGFGPLRGPVEKADWDPDKHPKWPKRSTEGVGGRFRPVNDTAEADNPVSATVVEPPASDLQAPPTATSGETAAAEAAADADFAANVDLTGPADAEQAAQGAKQYVESRLRRGTERLLARRAIRMEIVAGMRALAGIGVDIIPVFGEAIDAAFIAETVDDFAELEVETNAALQFARGGVRSLDELVVSTDEEAFPTYDALKKDEPESLDDLAKRYGPAGPGYDYHHIVTQGGQNAANLPPEMLQNSRNVIRMPRLLHEEITKLYAQKPTTGSGRNIQEFLSGKSYEYQRAYGLRTLRNFGILK